MAILRYSTFPKTLALLKPHHQLLYCHIKDTRRGGVLLLCREPVGVFYRPSWLGHRTIIRSVLPLWKDAVGVFYSSSLLGYKRFVARGGSYPYAEKQSVYSTAHHSHLRELNDRIDKELSYQEMLSMSTLG